MVIATDAETTLTLEPPMVHRLQARLAEMAASQHQLHHAHDTQLQAMLNKEHQAASTQDLYLKRASEARARERARIKQLMRDKNELTTSQIAHGADELRAP